MLWLWSGRAKCNWCCLVIFICFVISVIIIIVKCTLMCMCVCMLVHSDVLYAFVPVCTQVYLPLQIHMETRYLYQGVFLNCFSILVFWVPVYLDITISTRLIGHWTPGIQLPMLPTLGLQAYATMLGFYMGAEVLNQILAFWHQAFYPLINLFNSIFNHFLFISSSSFIWFYHNICRKYCRVIHKKTRRRRMSIWISMK